MATELDAVESPDGETVYVDRSDAEVGSQAPFFVVYDTSDRLDRWGYLCSNCESTDTAMDTMGRIECNACGNIRKPDEWDAAHE